MKYYEENWQIEDEPALKKFVFKFEKVSPVKLLGLSMSSFNDSSETNEKFISLALESTLVKILDSWQHVKAKGKDEYLPEGIDECGTALMKIVNKFMTDVVEPTFTKSSESQEKTE